MNNDNFEVIFAGQLVPGSQPEQVKAKVAAIFKTDVARVAHLFSGNPVVIKKGIDQQMALKYQAALQAAGAVCEIRDASQPVAPVVVRPVVTTKPSASRAPPAPQTAPLNISADKIAAMQASLAPAGSDLHQAKQVAAVYIPDISGLTVAPPGTVLSTHKKETQQPLPDISGLSIVKN